MENQVRTSEDRPGSCASGLRLLADLQSLDREIDRTRGDLERVPEELRIADQELQVAREEFSRSEQSLARVREGQVECEKQRAEAKAKLADYRTKQQTLKTNDEYRAMTNQIEFVKQSIDSIDSRVIELMYAEDGEKEKLEAARRKLDRSIERAQKKRLLLEQRSVDLERALRALEARRAELAPTLNIRLLRKYEQLRTSGKANAVVALMRGACGGCLTNVPPQHAVEIEAGTMYNCPICGRFVIAGGEPAEHREVD